MNLWLAAGSLAAVLALAGIAWALRLGGSAPLADDRAVIAMAEAMVSGFEGVSARRLDDGTAIVVGIDGSSVTLEPMGARFRARHAAAGVVDPR